jgi:hypothetical protein
MKTVTLDQCRIPNGRISTTSEPPTDLDSLRAASRVASARLLGALVAQRELLEAEIANLEWQVGANLERQSAARRSSSRVGAVTEATAAAAEPVPRVKRTAKPKANGTHDGPAKIEFPAGGLDLARLRPINAVDVPADPFAGCEPATQADDELRATTMEKVLEHLPRNEVRQSILGDCRLYGIEKLGDLVDHLTNVDGPTSAAEICPLEGDAKYLCGQLRDFFRIAGFADSNLRADGLPKEWLPGDDDPVAENDVIAGVSVMEERIEWILRRELSDRDITRNEMSMLSRQGATDLEILEALRHCFNPNLSKRGPEGMRYTVRGGTSPAIWLGDEPVGRRVPILAGVKLVDAVRHFCQISTAPSGGGASPAASPAPKPKRPAKPADTAYRPAALSDALGVGPNATWARLANAGANDADLVAAISAAFARAPGVGDDWSVDVSKRLGPRFWASQKGFKSKQPATLWGQSLIFAVRSLLEIGPPIGSVEQRPDGGAVVEIPVERRAKK